MYILPSSKSFNTFLPTACLKISQLQYPPGHLIMFRAPTLTPGSTALGAKDNYPRLPTISQLRRFELRKSIEKQN